MGEGKETEEGEDSDAGVSKERWGNTNRWVVIFLFLVCLMTHLKCQANKRQWNIN